MANHIIVLGFEGEYIAEGLLESILEMEKEGLIDLEDAVTASRGVGQDVQINQARSKSGKRVLKGSGAGLLAGLLLGIPVGGLLAGAAIGAVQAHLKEVGLSDTFVKDIVGGLRPNSSALFLLVRRGDVDEFVRRLRGYEISVMMTSLTPELQQRIVDALNARSSE